MIGLLLCCTVMAVPQTAAYEGYNVRTVQFMSNEVQTSTRERYPVVIGQDEITFTDPACPMVFRLNGQDYALETTRCYVGGHLVRFTGGRTTIIRNILRTDQIRVEWAGTFTYRGITGHITSIYVGTKL